MPDLITDTLFLYARKAKKPVGWFRLRLRALCYARMMYSYVVESYTKDRQEVILNYLEKAKRG